MYFDNADPYIGKRKRRRNRGSPRGEIKRGLSDELTDLISEPDAKSDQLQVTQPEFRDPTKEREIDKVTSKPSKDWKGLSDEAGIILIDEARPHMRVIASLIVAAAMGILASVLILHHEYIFGAMTGAVAAVSALWSLLEFIQARTGIPLADRVREIITRWLNSL